MTYFSEREYGELPRDNEEIGDEVWGGIRFSHLAYLIES